MVAWSRTPHVCMLVHSLTDNSLTLIHSSIWHPSIHLSIHPCLRSFVRSVPHSFTVLAYWWVTLYTFDQFVHSCIQFIVSYIRKNVLFISLLHWLFFSTSWLALRTLLKYWAFFIQTAQLLNMNWLTQLLSISTHIYYQVQYHSSVIRGIRPDLLTFPLQLAYLANLWSFLTFQSHSFNSFSDSASLSKV